MLFTRICSSFQHRAQVATVDYEYLNKEMKEKKIEAQRKSRTTQVVKIPKVNRHIVDNIHREEEEMDADLENVDKSSIKKKKRKLELSKALLTDPRFKEMFQNKVV